MPAITNRSNAARESLDEDIHTHALSMATVLFDSDSEDTQGLTAEQYNSSVERVLRGRLRNLRIPYAEWQKSKLPQKKRTRARFRVLHWLLGAGAVIVIVDVAVTGMHITSGASPKEALLNLLVIMLIGALWIRQGPYRTSGQRNRESYLLGDQYSDLVRNLILEPAISAAHEVKWCDSSVDHIRFQDGPKLSSKASRRHIISTLAHNRLAVALTRQNGCTIGIAGPRGCGKTELARSFTELRDSDSRHRSIPLFLWAPAKDDADTFMLRMLKELCIGIISAGSGALGEYESTTNVIKRRRRLVTGLVVTALISIGAAVLSFDFMGASLDTALPLITGSTLIWAGLGTELWVLFSRPRRSSSIDIKKSTLKLAAGLRSRVDFTETLSSTSQIGISTYGLSLTAGQGAELVRAPLNTIDVIREIRALVQAVSRDGWDVIIAIDEMDKMLSEEAAAQFLNQIKILFPIAGCSFIVSVSESAWSQFERRGLPIRDVLDSSFDEVIYLRMLSAAESRDVLKRRDPTISDPQALLCHCLSGGLPRDLLRWARVLARTAVETSPPETLTVPVLGDVLDSLLEEDLAIKVQAAVGVDTSGSGPPSSLNDQNRHLESWLALWTDHDAIEKNLVQSWSSLSTGDGASQSVRHISELLAYVGVVHSIRQAFSPGGPLSRLCKNVDFDDPIIRDGYERIAQARSKLSRDVQGSWDLLGKGRSVLRLNSLESKLNVPVQPKYG